MEEKYIGKFFHLPVDVDRRLTELSINECVGQGTLLREGAQLVLEKYYVKGEYDNDSYTDSD